MRIIVSILAVFALVAVFITSMGQAAVNAYLSDLPFQPAGLKYVNGGYFDGIRVNSHQTITTMSGSQYYSWDRPIQINGQEYDKAVLFHVVHDETVEATWSLNRRYSTLNAMIGLDDTQDMPGIFPHITVRFIGDHRTLGSASFQSVYGTPNPTPKVEISVAGINSLTVEVTMTGTGGGTNLDIVNPQLLGGSELATNASTKSAENQSQLAEQRAAAEAQLRILASKSQERFLVYKSRFQLEQIDRHVKLLNAALQQVSCTDCRTILQHKIAVATSLRATIAQAMRPVPDLQHSLAGGNVGPAPRVFPTVPPTPSPTTTPGGSHAGSGPGLGNRPGQAPCVVPQITGLSVGNGQPGDLVIINGSGFGHAGNEAELILSGLSTPSMMNVQYWSPTQILADINSDITGVQASTAYIYVFAPPCQQGGGVQKSNAYQFQFNPTLTGPVALPISRSDVSWGSSSCPGCGNLPLLLSATQATDTITAGPVFGDKLDDVFFTSPSYQLINGWTVQNADLDPLLTPTKNDGCQIGSGGTTGSSSPAVDVHCWVSSNGPFNSPGTAGYVLTIYIQGPVGTTYH
jgi:NPCBM/NEW2 domain